MAVTFVESASPLGLLQLSIVGYLPGMRVTRNAYARVRKFTRRSQTPAPLVEFL